MSAKDDGLPDVWIRDPHSDFARNFRAVTALLDHPIVNAELFIRYVPAARLDAMREALRGVAISGYSEYDPTGTEVTRCVCYLCGGQWFDEEGTGEHHPPGCLAAKEGA